MYYFGDPWSYSRPKGHFQGQKQNGRQIFQGQLWLFNHWSQEQASSFSCDFDRVIHFLYFFMTQDHLLGQKVNFKVK